MQHDIDFLSILSNILLGIITVCLGLIPFVTRQAITSYKDWKEAKEDLDKTEEEYWKNKRR